jgi:hypothetical protein
MLQTYEQPAATLDSIARAERAADRERRQARHAAYNDAFDRADVPLARMLDLAEEFDIERLKVTLRIVAALHGHLS